MFSRIRKRITYANVALTLALVFAMSGGAYAASRYIITSTKQISPKVLKALTGKPGKNGANGANGSAGAQGAQGPQGAGGPAGVKGETGVAGVNGTNGAPGAKGENGTTGFTSTLPSGKTETGAWTTTPFVAVEGEIALDPISFAIPLAAVPAPHFMELGKNSTECPGTAEKPEATTGNLCVYVADETNRKEVEIVSSGNGSLASGAGTTGAMILVHAASAGAGEFWGTWAVTAK